MQRRNFLTALTALPFFGSFMAMQKSAQANEGVMPLTGDVDFKVLQSWIKDWPITQLSSEMVYEDTPEGNRLLHQILSVGTRFKFTEKEIDWLATHENLDENGRLKSQAEFLRSCSNYKTAELFLCRKVANSLYFKARDQKTVYWREQPQFGVAIDTAFITDANGPHVEFVTQEKGRWHLLGGIVKFYTRLSFDDPEFWIDVLRFREGGEMSIIG